MNFEQAALIKFPELKTSTTITRKQVNEIVAEYGVSYPSHITNKVNAVGRGLFNFNVDLAYGVGAADPEPVIEETDEELIARIVERYDAMEIFVEAVANNAVNSLIIAGAAGLGKSFTVNKVLHRINNGEFGYTFHRGYLKATHLFRLLWQNREKGQTIVIDDCDMIFKDEPALNMLKAALELRETRKIGWGSEKEFIDEDGEVIPRYFDYEGSIIFLTNLPFSELAAGTGAMAPHLAALESRSLVLDLKIKTRREYMAKITHTIEGGMLRDKGLNESQEKEILDFMVTNIDRLKELSLRMCEKIASLYILDNKNWEKLAKTVVLK